MDITYPNVGRTMDPDMVPGSSPGFDVTLAPGAIQIVMAPKAEWPSDTNVAPGGGPEPWNHQHDLGVSGVIDKTLAATESWTQT
ncbi:hypothetical protein STEG23_022473 [Scotinomys teguina]